MKAPRSAAALAVCLLAMAAGTAAQMVITCSSGSNCQANPGSCTGCVANNLCSAGSIKLDLVVAPVGTNDRLAKCLTSFKVNLGANCQVSIEPLNAGSSFVNTIWEGPATPTGNLYPQLAECPTTTTGPYSVPAASAVPNDYTSTLNARRLQINNVIEDALEKHIYGPYQLSVLSTNVVWTNGKGVITHTTFTPAVTLEYAITTMHANYASELGLKLFNANTNGMVEGIHYRQDGSVNDWVGTPCPDGRYGIIVDDVVDIKACALCPAGHIGSGGTSCTPCPAGTAATVGSSGSCTACPAGRYSQKGSSDCLPCPLNTYADTTGSVRCTECPTGSAAWIPGSKACARCVAGVPQSCKVGSCTSSAPSSATSIIEAYAMNAAGTCGLTSGPWELKVLTKCSSWETTPLRFALEVKGDCSIDMKPIGTNTDCSDPTDTTDPDYGETQIKAYYHYVGDDVNPNVGNKPWEIRTVLPSNPASNTNTSGWLMSMEDHGTEFFSMKFWAATTDPSVAVVSLPSTVCAVDPITTGAVGNKVFVLGGKVGTLPATDDPGVGATGAIDYLVGCPAGSYPVYADGTTNIISCEACPTGSYCPMDGTTSTIIECPAGTYNPYLGRAIPCIPCDTSLGWTSYAGSASCNVEFVDTNCPDTNVGKFYDASAHSCLLCPAGTYRDPASTGCIDCPAGSYSYDGKLKGRMQLANGTYVASSGELGGCLPCPKGEYSPSTGLEGQGTSGASSGHCLTCPAGSIAVTDAQNSGTVTDGTMATGATTCDACPPGTYQNTADQTKACVRCPNFTYRTGDASPQNNVCEQVPAGFYLSSADQTEIKTCPTGTISFWNGATRIPTNQAQCISCSALDAALGLTGSNVQYAHTYAPRPGAVECVPCPGGHIPDTVTVTGPTASTYSGGLKTGACKVCPDGTYRDSETVSATCATCPAGYEVGPSNKQACTLCKEGFNKTTAGGANYCSECPKNTYTDIQGSLTCTLCPKGYEAPGTGAGECTPCPIGYYNAVPGTACDEAPQGTFTNRVGSVVYQLCPKGQFNSELAQDACTPCSPGYYTDAVGATACKTCLAGSWSQGQASSCTACQAGYTSYPGVDGTAQGCQRCTPGTFGTATTKQALCRPCTRGFQCPGFGNTKVSQCPMGTFSSREGLRLCSPCPVNTYNSLAVDKVTPKAVYACVKCPAGTNTRGLVGQSKCQPIRIQTRRLNGIA